MALFALAFGGAAFAQPAILISDESVAPGGSVNVSLDFLGDGTVTQLNFRFTYDSSVLTADITNCGAGNSTVSPGDTSCNIPSPGEIAVVHGQLGTTPFGDGTFGTVQFTAAGAADPQTVPLEFSVQSFSNAAGDAVAPNGSSEGSVAVTAPPGAGFYASTPDPNGNLNLGSAVVNTTTTPDVNLNVQNLSPDTNFDVTGIAQTGGPAGILNTPAGATVPFGDSVDFPFSCTPTSRGDNSGDFEVTHNSVNGASSPVAYTFSCTGLAPNVQVDPVTVDIVGFVGGPAATGSTDVTNPSGNFTSDATGANLAVTSDAAAISISNGLEDATISVDETDSVTFSCATASEIDVSETVEVRWVDPVAGAETAIPVTVNCTITDTAPVYVSDPAVGSTLSVSGPFGTQSSPTGVDVRNGNPNASADDLVINSATADNAVFTVTLGQTTFAANGAFDGTDDISVTCTPQGVGTVNGTLTVDTNDPAEPAGGFTYPLECTGTGDAVTSAPADGGTLNLGSVPPGDTTQERTIDFTNNGIAGNGSVDVSCQVTDASGVFSFTPDPISFTVAEGTTQSAAFQCTPDDISTFTASVACDITGPGEATGTANFTVACAGRALVIPTLSQWGLLVMMLSLLLVGGFAARRMMV